MTTPDHKAATNASKFYAEHSGNELLNLAVCYLDLQQKARASLAAWGTYEYGGKSTEAEWDAAKKADAALRAILED